MQNKSEESRKKVRLEQPKGKRRKAINKAKNSELTPSIRRKQSKSKKPIHIVKPSIIGTKCKDKLISSELVKHSNGTYFKVKKYRKGYTLTIPLKNFNPNPHAGFKPIPIGEIYVVRARYMLLEKKSKVVFILDRNNKLEFDFGKIPQMITYKGMTPFNHNPKVEQLRKELKWITNFLKNAEEEKTPQPIIDKYLMREVELFSLLQNQSTFHFFESFRSRLSEQDYNALRILIGETPFSCEETGYCGTTIISEKVRSMIFEPTISKIRKNIPHIKNKTVKIFTPKTPSNQTRLICMHKDGKTIRIPITEMEWLNSRGWEISSKFVWKKAKKLGLASYSIPKEDQKPLSKIIKKKEEVIPEKEKHFPKKEFATKISSTEKQKKIFNKNKEQKLAVANRISEPNNKRSVHTKYKTKQGLEIITD